LYYYRTILATLSNNKDLNDVYVKDLRALKDCLDHMEIKGNLE